MRNLLEGKSSACPEESNVSEVCNLRELSGLTLLLTEKTFSFQDGDGSEWTWSVTLGYEIAKRRMQPVAFYPAAFGITKEVILAQYPTLDEAYAATTDLCEPILLTLFGGGLLCLDGWHRLYKAVSEQVESLPAYLLLEVEAEDCLLMRVLPDGSVCFGKA